MSYDEARSGFAVDASENIPTNNYLLVGGNAYGYSYAATNLGISSFGDIDTYMLILDVGHTYTIISIGVPLFGTPVINSNFALLSRTGTVLGYSIDQGAFSSGTFTATDSLYYIQNYTDSVGY